MNRIIVSLDNISTKNIYSFLSFLSIRKLPLWGVKIKPTILVEMSNISTILKNINLKLMVDAKLYDTKTAMEDSLDYYINNVGADIVTVHMSSCFEPFKPKMLHHIAGVTVLTTFSDSECMNIYKSCVYRQVRDFKELAEYLGYKYIICSANDLNNLEMANIKPICPGIRPVWYKKGDDQVRIATPKEAINNGAELLIIGRPFTQYIDVLEKMADIIEKENSLMNYP